MNEADLIRSDRLAYRWSCKLAKERVMRKFIAWATAAALLVMPTVASAQRHHSGYDRDVRREVSECRRELRRADSRHEYRREQRECRREISQARRDNYRGWRGDHRDYRRHDRYYRR
jgi:hypothetical protein